MTKSQSRLNSPTNKHQALTRLASLGFGIGWLGFCLAGCATPTALSAPDPTEFISTRVAEELTKSAATALAPTPAELVFATVTPMPPLVNLPTAGATVTPQQDAAPSVTPGTPCADQACAEAAEHFWLERPIPVEAFFYVDRTYSYGSTQQGLREPHHGVEFVNPVGTLVLAAAPGTVIVAGDDTERAYGPATRFYGNLVVVELDQRYREQPVYTFYAHLSTVNVQVGQRVNTGDGLGAVGLSGVAIGPHLHFEVRVGENSYNATRNPELWIKPLASRQPWGALAGRVVDLDGHLLYNLTVVIRPVEVKEAVRAKYFTTYARETLNGDDGLQENFAIGDLPPGTYSVAVNTSKYYQQTVTVAPGRIAWVTFTVKPPLPTETPTP